MRIRYAHTNIIAGDWKKLAYFYQTVFECRPVLPKRRYTGQWLEDGTAVANASLEGIHLRLPGFGDDGPTLEIFQYDYLEPRLPPAANRRGLGHLAFAIDDISMIRENVLANGGRDIGKIVKVEINSAACLSFAYMADPEENIIELQSWT